MISVILVNFNGANDTIQCIRSIEKSTYSDYRIIVVDNHSTDDSVALLNEAQMKHRFELIESNINNGFSAGNNIGIKKAFELGTDYIWLLNNDTLVEPDTMQLLLNGIEHFPKCGLTIGKILYNGERERVWYAGGSLNSVTARTKHEHFREMNNSIHDQIRTVSFATGCCMFLSSAAIEKIGYLDEEYFLYEEDADYSYRVNRCGYEMYYIPHAIIYHKVSASTGESSPLSQYYSCRNKFLYIKKNYCGINKLIAYVFNVVQMIIRCLKKDINFKYFKAGFFAFCNNEKGRRLNSI